jgi:uncharacterized membrane protein YgaE (UPF0421/DUF939 family)
MSIPFLRRRRVRPMTAAARAVARRTPETLTVVRDRAQPRAVTIVRLSVTAVFAYLLALILLPGTVRPVLAPLTALLVAQVSLFQTLRSALQRVAAVVAGVLLAVGLGAWLGFTWWSLAVTIAVALSLGYALHLGDTALEVPISAMLILSSTGRAAATGRIVETFIGTAAGLVAGFVLTSPQVQPAEEAIEDLCRKMADLLDRMAAGLIDESFTDLAGDWLEQARALGGEIRRVDEALRQAEESTKLNPRSYRLPYTAISLRESLETLEHTATTVRVFARSLADSSRLEGEDSPLNDADVRERLSSVLRELSAAVMTYGRLATEHAASNHEVLETELDQRLGAARDQQDRLGELLGTDPAARPVGWPLRGELISQVDRIRNELRAGMPERRARLRRRRAWRRSLRAGRLRPPRLRPPRRGQMT